MYVSEARALAPGGDCRPPFGEGGDCHPPSGEGGDWLAHEDLQNGRVEFGRNEITTVWRLSRPAGISEERTPAA